MLPDQYLLLLFLLHLRLLLLEEIVENREQIEISKYYEKLSHPTILALEEFKRDELFYREREEESIEASHDEQSEK